MRALSPRGWTARLLFVAVLALGVVAPATAWAQNYPPSTTVTTGSNCTGSNANSAVCGTSVSGSSSSTSSSLPFTGGDVALLTVLGVAAAGGGVGLVMLGRRRSRSVA